MIDTFWKLCIHEAGHAAVALALDCPVIDVFARGDQGLSCHGATNPTHAAFIIAAGEIAVEMLRDDPPPVRRSQTQPQFASIPSGDVIANLLTPLGAIEPVPTPSDARALALYAIDGIEDQPQRWAERFNFVRCYAGRLVEQERDTILILARELYQRGFLTGQEIKNILREEN